MKLIPHPTNPNALHATFHLKDVFYDTQGNPCIKLPTSSTFPRNTISRPPEIALSPQTMDFTKMPSLDTLELSRAAQRFIQRFASYLKVPPFTTATLVEELTVNEHEKKTMDRLLYIRRTSPVAVGNLLGSLLNRGIVNRDFCIALAESTRHVEPRTEFLRGFNKVSVAPIKIEELYAKKAHPSDKTMP